MDDITYQRGRLDALYSTRLTPTLQAIVAAISTPPSATTRAQRSADPSNIMLYLQHDVGKWCSEYTWSAEDGMLGVKVLHNFGRLASDSSTSDDSDKGASVGVKRIDEEDAIEGGLKGRLSAGAEIYFSAKEKSAGGEPQTAVTSLMYSDRVSLDRNQILYPPRCNTPSFQLPSSISSPLPSRPRKIYHHLHHNYGVVQSHAWTSLWRLLCAYLAGCSLIITLRLQRLQL